MLRWQNKDPDARKLYSIDWNDELATGDAIDTSEWASTPTGLTLDEETHADGVASIWVAGGADKGVYEIRNRITTTDGMIDDRTALLVVLEQ